MIWDPAYEVPVMASPSERPADLSKDMPWLLGQLQDSLWKNRDAIGYYDKELEMKGHGGIIPGQGKPAAVEWPTCGNIANTSIDCFTAWKVKKPGAS